MFNAENSNKALKVFAIGNRDILLIVSNFGHFDLRIDQRSVIGRVFYRKNLDFTGKSPKFMLSKGNDTQKLEICDLTFEKGFLKMETQSQSICFTVDTENKKLLVKTDSDNGSGEYTLIVGGTKALVNSPNFDKCAKALADLTEREQNKYLLKKSDFCIKMLCLAMTLWDFEAISSPKTPICIKDLPCGLLDRRPAVIKMPTCYSAASYAFAREMHRNKEYLKNCLGLSLDMFFYDPSGVYPRIGTETEGLKSELAMAVSSCCIELSADFDDLCVCDEVMGHILRGRNSVNFAPSQRISSHERGVLRLDIHKNKSMTTIFDFGTVGALTVCSRIFLKKNGDMSKNVLDGTVLTRATAFATEFGSDDQQILMGTDPIYPFLLAFVCKNVKEGDLSYSFDISVCGFELSERLISTKSFLGAQLFVPMLYEKEQICFFVKKMTSNSGCAFLSGAFISGRDALLYKALERYEDAESVFESLSTQIKNAPKPSSSQENDPLNKAIRLCSYDAPSAKSHILKVLCAQSIDGSINCKESAARAVLEYINAHGDVGILRVKLPYTCDGALTARHEDVYMHLMRRAEAERDRERRDILEHLGNMYYHNT